MSQSLSKIWTHLIFSTKERYPFLSDETVRHDMHSYRAKLFNAFGVCPQQNAFFFTNFFRGVGAVISTSRC